MTFVPWQISNSAFSRFRSITSGRHLLSNGPSHAATCTRFSPDSTADDWLQQPDRKYVTVILNQTTKQAYDDSVFAAAEQSYRRRTENRLKAQAQALGYLLIPAQPQQPQP